MITKTEIVKVEFIKGIAAGDIKKINRETADYLLKRGFIRIIEENVYRLRRADVDD